MPTLEVETIERWEYDVRYHVAATDVEEAMRRILAGDVEYDSAELRERAPQQEVHRILRVTNEDTSKVIESERRLRALQRKSGIRK